MNCAMVQCRSGLQGTVNVNENVGDAAFSTHICQVCAGLLDLKKGGDIPEKANNVLRLGYKNSPVLVDVAGTLTTHFEKVEDFVQFVGQPEPPCLGCGAAGDDLYTYELSGDEFEGQVIECSKCHATMPVGVWVKAGLDKAELQASIDAHHEGSTYCGRCGWTK